MANLNFKGKKLLIIGGIAQHCKLVETARELGIITYVVDYLPVSKAPAKQIADFHYEYDITDYDKIEALCRNEHIDGALSSHLDVCQIPYQIVCERMGFPCFGTKEQFHILTDKPAFIETCKKYGVDVIPQYSEKDFTDESTCEGRFPVFVKPSDSRGSRGQTICERFADMAAAITFARSESRSGDVVIEKYMGDKQDFSASYMFVDGKAYLVRTLDRFLGLKEDGMDKSAILGTSPSENTDMYIECAESRIVNMLEKIGIRNGPVFFQGFIDGRTVRLYDPGLRFPGSEYDRCYNAANNTDLEKALIEFALTGQISSDWLTEDGYLLNGKLCAILHVVLRPGTIAEILGEDEVRSHPRVVSMFAKYHIGSTVKEHHNVNQRYGEIDLLCSSRKEMAETVDWIYRTLRILDKNGEDMKISMFNTDLL